MLPVAMHRILHFFPLAINICKNNYFRIFSLIVNTSMFQKSKKYIRKFIQLTTIHLFTLTYSTLIISVEEYNCNKRLCFHFFFFLSVLFCWHQKVCWSTDCSCFSIWTKYFCYFTFLFVCTELTVEENLLIADHW